MLIQHIVPIIYIVQYVDEKYCDLFFFFLCFCSDFFLQFFGFISILLMSNYLKKVSSTIIFIFYFFDILDTILYLHYFYILYNWCCTTNFVQLTVHN